MGTTEVDPLSIMCDDLPGSIMKDGKSVIGGSDINVNDFAFAAKISDKPWEFAFDAGRNTFLATEEIHFVRNVLTSVPADPIVRAAGPLRILVAAAQPVGFGRLSVDQEITVIRRGFPAAGGRGSHHD